VTWAETEVARKLEQDGWNVLKNGWPDFLCWKVGEKGKTELVCVEVKIGCDKLTVEQTQNHALLLSAGMPVFVCGPDNVRKELNRVHTLTAFVSDTTEHLLLQAKRLSAMLEKAEESFRLQRDKLLEMFEERHARYDAEGKSLIERFNSLGTLFESQRKAIEQVPVRRRRKTAKKAAVSA